MKYTTTMMEIAGVELGVRIGYVGGDVIEAPKWHLQPEKCCEGSWSEVEIKSLTVIDSGAFIDISEAIKFIHDELVELVME